MAITSNGEEEKDNDVNLLRPARSRSDSCNGNYRHTSLSNHVLNLAQSCAFWLFDPLDINKNMLKIENFFHRIKVALLHSLGVDMDKKWQHLNTVQKIPPQQGHPNRGHPTAKTLPQPISDTTENVALSVRILHRRILMIGGGRIK